MFGMLRFRARRLHRFGVPAVAQEAASGRLRRQVLGAVRSEAASGGDTDAAPGSGTRSRGPLLPGVALIVATATIAAAVAVAFAVSQSPAVQSRRPAQPGAGAGAPRALLQRSAGRAELVVSGMAEPPIGEVYELWLNRPGAQPQPTDALFMVTGSGDGWVEIPGSLQGVREVMVTSEPLGGSSSPTSLAVLRVRVPRAR
jgi:Anti-sigma-K factor rskA